MRQVYGMKVTRLTLGGLPTCLWRQMCYRRRKASGWGGRSQQKP